MRIGAGPGRLQGLCPWRAGRKAEEFDEEAEALEVEIRVFRVLAIEGFEHVKGDRGIWLHGCCASRQHAAREVQCWPVGLGRGRMFCPFAV